MVLCGVLVQRHLIVGDGVHHAARAVRCGRHPPLDHRISEWPRLGPLGTAVALGGGGAAVGAAGRPSSKRAPTRDSVAAARGMRVNVTRTALFCLAALLTAAAVSVVGAVGFLGLVAPHIARWLTGEGRPPPAAGGRRGWRRAARGSGHRFPRGHHTPALPGAATSAGASGRSGHGVHRSAFLPLHPSPGGGEMMRDTAELDAQAVSVRLGKSPVLKEVSLLIPRGQ